MILSIAAPPIPGGAVAIYTVIFNLLGIPAEALVVAFSIDLFIDLLATGFNQFTMPFLLINAADRIGELDKDILRKNN